MVKTTPVTKKGMSNAIRSFFQLVMEKAYLYNCVAPLGTGNRKKIRRQDTGYILSGLASRKS
jgi:hypothetical protein